MQVTRSIIRNVRDINASERQVLEHVLGHRLNENQQVIVQIVTLNNEVAPQKASESLSTRQLPEWCNVFAGLDEEQIANIDQVFLQRADLSRTSE